MRRCIATWTTILGLLGAAAPAVSAETLRVGSKRFTESYVLAEILVATARPHAPVEHRPGLGNTAILFAALQAGSIDLYPEYLGTIEREILKLPAASGSLEAVNRALAPLGLAASISFGFENTYALAVRSDIAAGAGLETIGDLASRPGLRLGLSHEFLGRADGWPGLKARYGLEHRPVGLDHGLAYEAIAGDRIDVTDIYSTDAKIGRYRLKVLRDDLGYFPRYDAVVLHRIDVPARFPGAWPALQALAGSIDARRMAELNAEAELGGRGFADIAAGFLASQARGALGAAAGRDTGQTQGQRQAEGEGPGRAGEGGAGRGTGIADAVFADDFWRLAAPGSLAAGRGRRGADDTVAGPARAADPGGRRDRRAAGADRAIRLRAAADRAQRVRGAAGGRQRARPASARAAHAGRPADRPADHPGGRPDRGGHLRGHRDDRRLHRGRRVRRADRHRTGAERPSPAARRRAAVGGAGLPGRRPVRAHRATGVTLVPRRGLNTARAAPLLAAQPTPRARSRWNAARQASKRPAAIASRISPIRLR